MVCLEMEREVFSDKLKFMIAARVERIINSFMSIECENYLWIIFLDNKLHLITLTSDQFFLYQKQTVNETGTISS